MRPSPAILIIGGGLAGLSAALALAPLPVLLLQPPAATPATAWAQGGIACAVGADDDCAAHGADTLAAGDGLCDPEAVARIIGAGPHAIAWLAAHGARFDRDGSGAYRLGLEAAHGRRRIIHAGDATGAEVLRALAAAAAAAPHIQFCAATARRLLLDRGRIGGVWLDDGRVLAAGAVILATGGIGGLYADTTNPLTAWGQGLVLAARAGARLADLEFVQFHPTALASGADPMTLISEAVRGEGAVLIDGAGQRFLAGHGRAELEPRDRVARAVFARTSRDQPVYLDARQALGLDARQALGLDARQALGARFAARFPAIDAACRAAGIDPATQPIPVRPAAHYHMGGIAVDEAGRSSVAGLYACGECAATGLHGANRLASNSLLEAAVTGLAVADAIRANPPALPPAPRAPGPALAPADPARIRPLMTRHVGLLRTEAGLHDAAASLLALADTPGPACDPALVGLAITLAALRRQESRGAHARTDFPDPLPQPRRQILTLATLLRDARAPRRAAA